MKNSKILSLGIAMLVSFGIKAQEKTVSEKNSLQTQVLTKSFTKSKDTLEAIKVSSNFVQSSTPSTRVIICAPSRPLQNEPLYILDGVVINSKQFSKVNPNDIQEINILKDADAISKYGNQGRNGVIIITTKKKNNQNNNDE
jgi:TonB-dependent SusC/RagA subfamily outer membrane receptor